MKSSARRFFPLAMLVFCFAAPHAFSQNTNMYFNGNYQGGVWCGGPEGCVATGFYDGSINNVNVGPSQAPKLGMICDDYFDNTYTGETWTASGIDVANLNSSNIKSQTLFGSTIGLAGYAELAYLVGQMFALNPSASSQSNYSQAIWYITSAGKISASSLSLAALNLVFTAAAYAASTNDSLSQYANLWLYTPNPRGPNEAQEMWGNVAVAEGGAALGYLALAFAATFGGMYFRRRMNPLATTA